MISVGPDTVLGVVLLELGWSYESAGVGCNVRDASGLPVRGLDRDHDGPLTCAEAWAVLHARGLVDRDPAATHTDDPQIAAAVRTLPNLTETP